MKRFTLLLAALLFSHSLAWAQNPEIPETNDATILRTIRTESKPTLLLYRYSDSRRFPLLKSQLAQFKTDFQTETGKEMQAYSLSIQASPRSVQKFEVRSSPTLLAIKDGRVLSRLELVIDENAAEIPAWFYCSMNVNPEKNCHTSVIPEIDFLKLPEIITTKPGIVLVKVAATFCIPCQYMRPVIEEIAVAHPNDLTVLSAPGHVDYRSNPAQQRREEEITLLYHLNGAVPALILFKDGKFINSRTGYDRSEGRAGIEAWINSSLNP